MWQWVDDNYGPMGWFSDDEKSELDGTQGFTNGKWVPVSEEEVKRFNRYLGQLAYEQS